MVFFESLVMSGTVELSLLRSTCLD